MSRPAPPRFAFATCAALPDLDPDDRLAAEALLMRAARVDETVWDDPGVDWSAYAAVVIRSCWDYHQRMHEFRRWLDDLSARRIRLINSYETLCWNLDKRYLAELEGVGVPVVPTEWVPNDSVATLASIFEDRQWGEAVVKPCVSLNAWHTWRVSAAEARDREADWQNALEHGAHMVQLYLPEVADEGEWSFAYLGGELSHVVLKRPKAGDFRVQEEFGGSSLLVKASHDVERQARAVLDALPVPSVYARVDGVVQGGRFLVMEVELIDPTLYLRVCPEAAARFADVLLKEV